MLVSVEFVVPRLSAMLVSEERFWVLFDPEPASAPPLVFAKTSEACRPPKMLRPETRMHAPRATIPFLLDIELTPVLLAENFAKCQFNILSRYAFVCLSTHAQLLSGLIDFAFRQNGWCDHNFDFSHLL